jgi:hypothetical protein
LNMSRKGMRSLAAPPGPSAGLCTCMHNMRMCMCMHMLG